MTKCKKIREVMLGDYDTAADQGVSKKLLKKIIKERALESISFRSRTSDHFPLAFPFAF